MRTAKLSFEEKKRLKAESASLKKHLEKVMLKVEEIEEEIANFDAFFLEADFFQKNDRVEVAKVEQRRAAFKAAWMS
ncbi:MAG: hypothetical protein ACREGC_01315 [Minisyncoccia bacterium]